MLCFDLRPFPLQSIILQLILSEDTNNKKKFLVVEPLRPPEPQRKKTINDFTYIL